MKRFSALCLALGVLGGCGGGSSGSGAFSSGISPGKQLDALTPEEKSRLCAVYISFVEAVSEPEFCTFGGLRYAVLLRENPDIPNSLPTLPDACRESESQCLQSGSTGLCPAFVIADYSGCRANVGLLEECAQESIDQTLDAFSGLSCDMADEVTTTFLDMLDEKAGERGPKCNELKNACPSLFEDSVKEVN